MKRAGFPDIHLPRRAPRGALRRGGIVIFLCNPSTAQRVLQTLLFLQKMKFRFYYYGVKKGGRVIVGMAEGVSAVSCDANVAKAINAKMAKTITEIITTKTM